MSTAREERRSESIERYLISIVQDDKSEYLQSISVRMLLRMLRGLSYIYRSAVVTRLWLYERGLKRHHTLGCQVISVGNLTVGGTGKTPVVERFARELEKQGRVVAILSRGYKKEKEPFSERLMDTLLLRKNSKPPRVVSDGKQLLLNSSMSGDEPYMLASNLPNVPVLVDKNRVKSGRFAINTFGCDTLILDDGFQYLQLKHQLDIVLVDKTNPFGYEHVLPRGLLREPVEQIRRARFIFITKSDGKGVEQLKERIRQYNTEAEIIECCHEARYLRNLFNAEEKPLSLLQGAKVAVISGIAVPEGFESEVEQRGATILLRRRYADHHRYSQQEIMDLINEAAEAGAEMIVTTEKDAVRFPRMPRRDIPVYYLRVDIEILSGEENFQECIRRICFKKE